MATIVGSLLVNIHVMSIIQVKVSSLNLKYKAHKIPKLECFSSRLAVAFVQIIEARC